MSQVLEVVCAECFAGYELHFEGPPPLTQSCELCRGELIELAPMESSVTAVAGLEPGQFKLVQTYGPLRELRVWLDDDRVDRAAPSGWIQVTTAVQAIELLRTGKVAELSLDHDLGDDRRHGRGVDVIDFLIEQQEVYGRYLWPREGITLHTANPAGRDAMARAIRRYAGRAMAVEEAITPGGKPRFRFYPPYGERR